MPSQAWRAWLALGFAGVVAGLGLGPAGAFPWLSVVGYLATVIAGLEEAVWCDAHLPLLRACAAAAMADCLEAQRRR